MLKGFVSGEEKDIKRIPMFDNGVEHEGWEVRDNQDRLIWGREDEFQTATGTLPFKGYSLPLKVKSLLGNAVQNGTPSPDNIIMPEMCGVRTGNLHNPETDVLGFIDPNGDIASSSVTKSTDFIPCESGSQYVLRVYKTGTLQSTNQRTVDFYASDKSYIDVGWDNRVKYALNGDEEYLDVPFVVPTGARFLRFCYDIGYSKSMLNLGSTALPYEPYGYKIPFTCAGQTTPVYLGEVPTVRRVKKLVLTGEEPWTNIGLLDIYGITVSQSPIAPYTAQMCSHFISGSSWQDVTNNDGKFGISSPQNQLVIHYNAAGSISNFKAFLAAQYAAGNPVTVWYVLATPETAIVNELLCKISTYADELNSTVATLPEIPTTTGENTLTVDTTLAPSKLEVSVHAKKIHYGFKIDKSVDNSENAVIYTHDAVTMTPAHMDFTNDRFDYGSWGNAFFVRDCYPVALNLDGTIAYRLDPDDYTKKMDGTASDIFYELLATEPSDWSTQWKQYYTKSGDEYVLNSQSEAPTFATDTYYKLTYSSSFTGNFMMAFPKVWFYRHEDSQYNYIEISNHKLSDDWKCYAHINANGQEVDFIYLPLFKGVIKDSKLRSLPGQIPQGGTSGTTEVNAATALGSRWQIWDHSSVELINDLLTLMSKSIDSQGRFGRGRSSGYDSTDTVTYGKLQSGTLIKSGKFHGFSSSYKEVKVFGIEGFWANRLDRLQGMLLVNNVWKIKMTPPYNFTGTDFVTLSNAEVPSGNGYLSKVQTSEYGSIPASIANGSSTKYFKDYFYKTATDTRVAFRGGSCNSGGRCGFRFVNVDNAASSSYWGIGASPVYK